MRITTPRGTLVIGLLVLLLVAAGSWFLLLRPSVNELDEARTELVDTLDANRLLTVRLRGLEQQRDELRATEATAADLQVVFPPTADQPGFFRMVDRAAAAAGISPDQITTLSPTAPVPASVLAAEDAGAAQGDVADATEGAGRARDLAVQLVEISVEATPEQTQALLAGLERMDRALLVQSLVLTASSEEKGTTTTQITGSAFVAPPLVAPDLAADGVR